VFWLPLGCDGDIHNPGQTGKVCDVGFAGTVSPAHRRRAHLLAQIGDYFHLRAERRYLEDMAQLYAQSRIVFNNAIAGDLNMRVFEAMASGSLLLTDPVPESGLDELFEAGRHFVYYEDENLVQTVRYYLDRPEERERIAREGQRHVLAHHTYLHRARALIATVRESLPIKP
jgi:spore maturation protein CgeB